MADRKDKERKEGSRGILKGKEAKQTKLRLEEVDKEKRVKFHSENLDEKLRQEVKEQVRLEIRKEFENMRREWEEKVRMIEEKIIKIEEYIEQQKEIEVERKRKEMEGRWSEREEVESNEDSEVRSRASDNKSCKSYRSYDSRSVRSGYTIDSEGLSDREIDKLKRMVIDKEKEERRENIVIKGVDTDKRDLKKWVKEFLEEKMEVEVEVISCRKSGKVLVAKLKDWQMKKKVMENKHKLKGGRIFIENDLTWQERKTQEKIHKWVKEEREKGRDVKVGYARVRIGGNWRKWEEVEREIEARRKENEAGEREEEKAEDRRDFA